MCEWENGADGYCSVWNVTQRKARKQHLCWSCDASIQPGQTYRHIGSVFDGTASTFKQCLACAEAYDEFNKRHSDGVMLEELQDALEYCVREDGSTSWATPFLEAMKQRNAAAKIAQGGGQ